MIRVECGDLKFQETLTEKERAYLHAGCNWISKLGRESFLKGLHALGWTLDGIDALPAKKRSEVVEEADRCWTRQDWSDAKYLKDAAAKSDVSEIKIGK